MEHLRFNITVSYEQTSDFWGGGASSSSSLEFRVPLEMFSEKGLNKLVEQAIAEAKVKYPEEKQAYDERQAKWKAEREEAEAKKLAEQEAV